MSRRAEPLHHGLSPHEFLLIVAAASALALVFGIAVAGKLSPAGFGDLRRGIGGLWSGPGPLSPAAVAVARGRAVRCACFGRTTTTVGPLTLLRSALLLALAVAGLALALAAPGGPDPVPVPSAALLTVPAGSALGLLLVSLEDLVALFRPASLPSRSGVRA